MKRSFIGLVLLAGLALGGCASGPAYKEMASSIPTLGSDQGRVYIYRPGFFGAALQPTVKLNEQPVGTSKAGGFFYVDRPAGKYVVSTATETENTLSFVLDGGETKYVRTDVTMGLMVGHIVPTLESQDKAMADIAGLKFTGAASAPAPTAAAAR